MTAGNKVFAVPVFFVVFRETLETVVIVSVLLAWLKQTLDGPNADKAVYKKLVKQVWWGVILGFLVCMIIGGGIIGAFYRIGKDIWGNTEDYWEGAFSIFASIIISIMGVALLRVSRMQEKWRVKLAQSLEADTTKGWRRWTRRYAMFALPFITVVREGLEAVVFVAGVSFSSPASAVPLAVFVGLLAGSVVGYFIFKGGASAKLQVFLVISTCVLYLVAAGLFSKGVWNFEDQAWSKIIGGDAAETGSGPGSYDISKSVWHVNFGNPELNGGGGWGIFNAILGWQNSATYGSVISYNLYWIIIIAVFLSMRYKEAKGHWPLLKAKKVIDEEPLEVRDSDHASNSADSGSSAALEKEKKTVETIQPVPTKEVQ